VPTATTHMPPAETRTTVEVPRPPASPTPQARNNGKSAYVALLWQRIEARRPGGIELQGSALVEFRLDRSGHLISMRIERASGVALLDRLALRAVKNAAPFPAPPADVPDAELDFTVSIDFL